MQSSMLTDIWCQQPHTFKNSEPTLPISRLLKVRFICILILEPFRVPLWKVPKQIEGLEKVVKKASHPTKPKGCQNPRAPGAAALTKRPSISKGWGHGALGIFLALPVWQHWGTMMQGHMPACSSASVHKQKFLEVCVGWGSSAPTASLLLWFGEAKVLHAEKCNRLPWGHGRGRHQKLQLRSSSLPLFWAEPCWTQPFKKNKQTRNKGSLTHRHHWVSLLRHTRGEEVLPSEFLHGNEQTWLIPPVSKASWPGAAGAATEVSPKGLRGLASEIGLSDLVQDQLSSTLICCNMPVIVEELTPLIIDGALKPFDCGRASSSYHFISWPWSLPTRCGQGWKGAGPSTGHTAASARGRHCITPRCPFQQKQAHKLQTAQIFSAGRREPALIAHPRDK